MRVFDIDQECTSEHVRSIDGSGNVLSHQQTTNYSEKPARRQSQGILLAQKQRPASRMSSSEKYSNFSNFEKQKEMDKQILQRTKKILMDR
jgi:hypothetical protein